MQLLIYRASHDRIADELASRGIEPVILEHDGSLMTTDGRSCTDARPEAAWFSREMFLTPGAPVGALLKKVHAGSVRWVQSSAAGYEHPIFKGLLDAGIRLTINDASSIAIAEYVMAETLACFQPLTARRAAQTASRWERMDFRELHGSRWLIVGYGNIGQEVGRRASAFGAEVIGVRRTPAPDPFACRVVASADLAAEVPAADVIVVSAAANPDNLHLIDRDLLGAMKQDAVLVNVARGSLIDSAALLAALDAGRPGQAVLDVFEEEPLPAGDPLWHHPRVRITAHCSSSSDGTRARGEAVFLEHLDAWLAGTPLRLEVRDSHSA